MIRALLLLAALTLTPLLGLAQVEQPRKPKQPAGTGTGTSNRAPPPARLPSPIVGQTWIGMRAHDFELDGSDGESVKLSSLRGDWVVLVFADQKKELVGLASVVGEMRKIGARIVGVCHEKAHGIERYAKRESLPFLLLADPTGQVCTIYGLYDHTRRETIPGLLILDREGYVRMALLGRIPPPDQTARLARFAVTGL